ncbi:hypothetical protein M0R04_12665 [Candidatus Dojkabacteria bacterium]|jgi:hypothetical protein|nr:hypothetical protein [Candidatus Dojkabacteria bacterium]
MIDSQQKQQQLKAMEMQRFGYTRAEILKEKGNKCSLPLQFSGDYHEGDLVIDHIKGGGRHDTERGMIVENLTHNMDNLRVVCRRHNGMMDRLDFTKGIGHNTKGNSNNPSQ